MIIHYAVKWSVDDNLRVSNLISYMNAKFGGPTVANNVWTAPWVCLGFLVFLGDIGIALSSDYRVHRLLQKNLVEYNDLGVLCVNGSLRYRTI